MFCIGILVVQPWLGITTSLELFHNHQNDPLREVEQGMPDSFRHPTKENKRFYKPNGSEGNMAVLLGDAPDLLVHPRAEINRTIR